MIIKNINARTILNSHADLTVEVVVKTEKGIKGVGSAPKGTSTGKHEVKNFFKNRVKTIKEFNFFLKRKLIGRHVESLKDVFMIEEALLPFGAGITLSTSYALIDALSRENDVPKWKILNPEKRFFKHKITPISKIIGGSVHSGYPQGKLILPDIQEFLVFNKARNLEKKIIINKEVHNALKEELIKNKIVSGVDYEGGWIAPISNVEAFKLLEKAVAKVKANYKEKIFIGVDIASSNFYKNERYVYYTKISEKEKQKYNTEEQYELIKTLIKKYKLKYVEDPFNEEDFMSHAKLTKKTSTMIVGDDLFVTDPERLKRGIEVKACNSIIIKPNQIGSLKKTFETIKIAKKYKYISVISHRSKETNDDTIAHIGLAQKLPFIKIGIINGERVSKLNALLRN